MKTFCLKLYHSDHNHELMRQINAVGLIYNHCIALNKKLKKHERFAYISEIVSQAIQDVTDRIDLEYNLFWSNLKRKKKCSSPKFRNVRIYKLYTLKRAGWKLDEAKGKNRIGNGYLKSRNIEGKIKTARRLCEEYAVICLETLNMKGMVLRCGRKVHSLGFYNFVEILKYEAMKLGTQIIFVDKYFPSSHLCSVCGYRNKEVKNLKIREWECSQLPHTPR